MRAQRRKRGFTLLEMVIVMAIVAIGMGVAVYSNIRSRELISIERALTLLRVRMERAQSLAAVAGSRLGTPRLINNCPIPGPGAQMWVQIDTNGQITYPAEVVRGANGTVTVTCEVFNLTQMTNGEGIVEFPTAQTIFAFTSDGRVILPGGPGGTGSVYVSFKQAVGNKSWAFRILPSGVFCMASRSTQLVCDEDA